MDAKQWAERLDERRGLSWREHDELAALLRAGAQAVEDAANWRAVAGEGAIQHAATRSRLERAITMLRTGEGERLRRAASRVVGSAAWMSPSACMTIRRAVNAFTEARAALLAEHDKEGV